MHWKYQKLGFLGILGVKTEICIFLNPKRHLLTPKHAFWHITRPNRSTGLTCGGVQEAKRKKKRTTKTCFLRNKGTSLRQNTRFDVLLAQIGPRVWPVGVFKKQKKNEKTKKKRTSKTSMLGCAGEVVCEPISMKFGSLIDQYDVMMCAKFHRPRSLSFVNIEVQRGRF